MASLMMLEQVSKGLPCSGPDGGAAMCDDVGPSLLDFPCNGLCG